MPVLNHHIVTARDKQATALFFAEILGLDQPVTSWSPAVKAAYHLH